MKEVKYWNHNTAYFSWIKKETEGFDSILDVGCGDGSLIGFLDDGKKHLVGIDPDTAAILSAEKEKSSEKTVFINNGFLEEKFSETFDAIIFVASIHHMDMEQALQKAVSLLNKQGVLLIVGLFQPSSLTDYIIEGLRVLPCLVSSKLHHMQSSEDVGVVVSYQFPKLNEVKTICSRMIPDYHIRQGLYYRYLLDWHK